MCWWINSDRVGYRLVYTQRTDLALSGRIRRSVSGVFILCALLVGGCRTQGSSQAGLLAIDSLLSAQAMTLSAQDAALTKQVTLNAKDETTSDAKMDSSEWSREWEAFGVLNALNKPVNRNFYELNDARDTRSNLTVRSFTTAQDLPLKFVRLYFQGKLSALRRIEALYESTNGLYETRKNLVMEFQDVRGTALVTAYTIEGGQKMLFDDSLRYSIRGQVILKH